MNGPILTADHAWDLNKLVRDLIDPRLFLLCNYEPTIRHVIGEDGRYLLNIQDLYKFAIDSSCIIKQYYRIVPQSLKGQFNRLRTLLDHISMFRTVFDHNVSAMDGQLSAEHLDSYSAWVHATIGKSAPETMDDFKVLNQKLADMAEELRRLLDKFIRCVSRMPDQAKVIRIWTDMTLHWFCNNTKTDIYKGHLISAYIANARAANRDTPNLYRPWVAGKKVSRWIEQALFHPVQKEIDQISGQIRFYEDMLNGQNPMYEAMRVNMTQEKAKEAENQFRLTIQQKQQELDRWEREKQDLQSRIGPDAVGYFYRNLEHQLRDTIESLEQDGVRYTLLPQDLMQEDIARIFGTVPSPDGDF